MDPWALLERVEAHEECVAYDGVTLEPSDLFVGIQFLTDAAIAGVKGFTLSVSFRETHPSRALKLAAHRQPDRAINWTGISVAQSETDIPHHLGRIIDFAVCKQHVSTIGLAAQRKYLTPANLSKALGFAAGVLNPALNKPVSHGAPRVIPVLFRTSDLTMY